jgi:hypothetical protein
MGVTLVMLVKDARLSTVNSRTVGARAANLLIGARLGFAVPALLEKLSY